jgi:hypothetical protein
VCESEAVVLSLCVWFASQMVLVMTRWLALVMTVLV